MRHSFLFALALVLAACAGPSSSAPDESTTPPPAPTVAEEPEPAEPLTVAEYDAMADQLCACPDIDCAEPRRRAMFVAAKRPAAEADRPALAATYDRAMGCFVPLMTAPPRQ